MAPVKKQQWQKRDKTQNKLEGATSLNLNVMVLTLTHSCVALMGYKRSETLLALYLNQELAVTMTTDRSPALHPA